MPPCEGGYKNFKIGELFEAKYGDTDIQAKHINGLGLNVVSSGTKNNGIIGKTDVKARIFSANTITVDMFGNSYYQSSDYKLVTHARVFSLALKNYSCCNKYIGLYFVSLLHFLPNLFSYNNMASWEKLKNICISLPTTSTGDIDFAFMESRIRELEEERMRELEAYLAAAGFANCDLTPAEQGALRKFNDQQVNFQQYTIGDLFEIAKGKRLTKADMLNGEIRFIGATASNNGITAYVGNNSHLHPEGTITVTYNGSVGEAFYQTAPFWASDDVNILYSKQKINETIALYFLAPLRQKGKGYGYAYKWTKEKMTMDTLLFPTTPDGNIDYPFMETYISAIKKQTIAALKDFIAREHTAYEQVINN